jgi:hypothetical protein
LRDGRSEGRSASWIGSGRGAGVVGTSRSTRAREGRVEVVVLTID